MGTPGTQTQGPRTSTDTARDKGKEVAQSAADSTKQVAATAREEASNVAGEVSTQARSLADQASEEVRGKVAQQQSRAAQALRTTGEEFTSLASKGEYSQLTSELTRRAAERARSMADYVGRTSPAEVLGQIRSFARRRPGAFLLAAALAGAATGRLLKGAVTRDEALAEPATPVHGTPGLVPDAGTGGGTTPREDFLR